MYIKINDQNYEVIIERKHIRHIYIRVKEDLKIYVSASRFASLHDIENILYKELTSIERMINKQMKRNNDQDLLLGQSIDIVLVSNQQEPELYHNKLLIRDRHQLDIYYKKLSLKIFKERLDALYPLFDEHIPYPKLKVRKMKSRWGVCNRRNTSITINIELIKKEYKYIDYVIIHELCHFVHFDHSASFWNLVGKYNEDYKLIRKELRE
jgi:predicted metal-dependent hydrolase